MTPGYLSASRLLPQLYCWDKRRNTRLYNAGCRPTTCWSCCSCNDFKSDITCSLKYGVDSEAVTVLSLWCSTDSVCNERIASNQQEWAEKINFEVDLSSVYRLASQVFRWVRSFKVFTIPWQRAFKVLASPLLWTDYYETSRFFDFQSPSGFTNFSGICNVYGDDTALLSVITSIENPRMKSSYYIAIYRGGYLSHVFRYLQFNRDHRDVIVQLSIIISVDLDVVSQFEAICEAGFDPVLSICALQRSPEIV